MLPYIIMDLPILEIGKGAFWDSYDHFSTIANLGHRNICNLAIIIGFANLRDEVTKY